MSAVSRIQYPVTLEDLRTNPAMVEHWPQVTNLIQGFLMTYLVKNAVGVSGGDNADKEAAGLKAISKLLEDFRSLSGAAKPVELPKMKTLNRFSAEQPQSASPEK